MEKDKSLPEEPEEHARESERRLWYDYLSKVNDRELQTSRASGFTIWILIAAMVAVLRNATLTYLDLTHFSDATKAVTTVFLLQLDAAILFTFTIFFLLLYCIGKNEVRLRPEYFRRMESIGFWIITPLILSLYVGHFFLFVLITASPFIKWSIAFFGLFWAVNNALSIVRRVKKTRKEKKHKIFLPMFSTTVSSESSFKIAATNFLIGVFASIVLVGFLGTLSKQMIGWLLPLTFSSYLIATIGIFVMLMYRIVASISKAPFWQLEQDIVLERLAPNEIRSRYVAQILGPSLTDWLNTIKTQIGEVQTLLSNLKNSVQSGLTEVESIDPQYKMEREGRATILFNEVRDKIKTKTDMMHAIKEKIMSLKEVEAVLVADHPTFFNEMEALTAQIASVNEEQKSLMELCQKHMALSKSS